MQFPDNTVIAWIKDNYHEQWNIIILLLLPLGHISNTKGHYDRTWALDVANILVCFMNGLMVEHNGLGITFFSVDILKDMVACWYAWVLNSSC